jgi:hypothetical protein
MFTSLMAKFIYGPEREAPYPMFSESHTGFIHTITGRMVQSFLLNHRDSDLLHWLVWQFPTRPIHEKYATIRDGSVMRHPNVQYLDFSRMIRYGDCRVRFEHFPYSVSGCSRRPYRTGALDYTDASARSFIKNCSACDIDEIVGRDPGSKPL